MMSLSKLKVNKQQDIQPCKYLHLLIDSDLNISYETSETMQ